MTAQHPHPPKVNPVWIVLSVVLGLVFVFSIIIWLGTQHTADGSPLLEDAGALLVAIVAGLGGLATAVVPVLLKIRSSTSATEEHVVNSHGSTILRDDIDELKAGVKNIAIAVGRQGQVQSEQGKDILGLRRELGQIRQTERDQWEAIEDTAASIRRRKEH